MGSATTPGVPLAATIYIHVNVTFNNPSLTHLRLWWLLTFCVLVQFFCLGCQLDSQRVIFKQVTHAS